MGVVEAWHGEPAVQVDDLGVLVLELQKRGVVTHSDDAVVEHGHGRNALGIFAGTGRLQAFAGQDVAMEEDRVRRCGLGVCTGAGEQA